MPAVFQPDELALVAAVHASPKDDAPRLRYADWLREHGAGDHADFIRLQCQEPYVALANRDWQHPVKSTDYPFPWDDPTAQGRLDRLIALLPVVYRSERYERQRAFSFYEEHVRGLPLAHAEGMDFGAPTADAVVADVGRLSRVDLTIRLEPDERLTGWLAHPVMERVDRLRIQPTFDPEADLDKDYTMNSYYDEFWAIHIPLLAAWPLLERLEELHPHGCHSTGPLTAKSAKNIERCRELLEPHVHVEYSY